MDSVAPSYDAAALDELVWQLQRNKFIDIDCARDYCIAFDSWVSEQLASGGMSSTEADAYQADLHFILGRLAYIRGDVDVAMHRFALGIAAAERADVVDRQVLCLRAQARALEYAGMQAESTRLMFDAIDRAEAADDDRLRSLAMTGLSSLYESQGAYEQVLESSLKAHERALSADDEHLLWATYGSVGLAYGYLGRTDEALHWLERGRAEVRTDEAPELELFIDLYRMYVLGTADRVDEAIEIAEARLDQINQLPAQHRAASFVDVAELYLSRSDFERAEEMLAHATRAAEHPGLKAHRIRYTKFAADLHEAKGDHAEALRLMRRYAELDSELRGRNARLRLVAAERHFADELAKKTEEMHQLRTVELVQHNDQLEVLNRQKDEILSVVAHDLRNPLAAIAMLSEMLLFDHASSGDSELIEQLHAIKSASAEMGETIDQLLYLQRPNDPLLGVPLAEVIAKSVSWSTAHAMERSVTGMDHVGDVAMEVDEALFRRALDDVLWTSIQASNAGDIVRLTADRRTDGVGVAITVPGPLNEHAERTLYIARRLIERMGGSLRITRGPMRAELDIGLRSRADLRAGQSDDATSTGVPAIDAIDQ